MKHSRKQTLNAYNETRFQNEFKIVESILEDNFGTQFDKIDAILDKIPE